jgi:chaperone modulatory protein CbpM
MLSEDMILASEFCNQHNIELSLLYSLNESGLIEITTVEEKVFVPENQLVQLEKMIRLYNEMDINLEGIETITHLLQRINDMQQQIQQLTNKLRGYEGE